MTRSWVTSEKGGKKDLLSLTSQGKDTPLPQKQWVDERDWRYAWSWLAPKIKASRCVKGVMENTGEEYLTGWHIFESREAALKWAKEWVFNRENTNQGYYVDRGDELVVAEVDWEDQAAKGWNPGLLDGYEGQFKGKTMPASGCGITVVARRMKVIGVLDSVPLPERKPVPRPEPSWEPSWKSAPSFYQPPPVPSSYQAYQSRQVEEQSQGPNRPGACPACGNYHGSFKPPK
jgi:hypothetical protein